MRTIQSRERGRTYLDLRRSAQDGAPQSEGEIDPDRHYARTPEKANFWTASREFFGGTLRQSGQQILEGGVNRFQAAGEAHLVHGNGDRMVLP